MKKLIIFLFLAQSLFAQSIDGTIEYNFSHKIDSTNLKTIKTDIFRLYFNNEKTVFFSKNKVVFDSIFIYHKWADGEIQDIRKLNLPTWTVRDYIYKNFEDKNLFIKKTEAGIDFLIKENKTEIIWDITTETKDILGKICQKATTTFKGRQWIAWFTTEIPNSVGPYKFQGLPGAILELNDSKDHIHYTAVKIIIKNENNTKFIFPGNIEKITQKEFDSFIKARAENPQLGNNMGISIARNDGKPIVKKIEIFNNPIELTE